MVERFLGRNVRRKDKKQCDCRRGWRVLNVFFLRFTYLTLTLTCYPSSILVTAELDAE